MAVGIPKCVVGGKRYNPLASEMLLSKTYIVDHYVPLMLFRKNTVFLCQALRRTMGGRRLEWIELCKTCNMEIGALTMLQICEGEKFEAVFKYFRFSIRVKPVNFGT